MVVFLGIIFVISNNDIIINENIVISFIIERLFVNLFNLLVFKRLSKVMFVIIIVLFIGIDILEN